MNGTLLWQAGFVTACLILGANAPYHTSPVPHAGRLSHRRELKALHLEANGRMARSHSRATEITGYQSAVSQVVPRGTCLSTNMRPWWRPMWQCLA